jgi:hypothetical protein
LSICGRSTGEWQMSCGKSTGTKVLESRSPGVQGV